MSQALARDQLGIPSVTAFLLASIAPMTARAGSSRPYAVTGLTGIPVAIIAVAAVIALFCVGYVAMARRIPERGGILRVRVLRPASMPQGNDREVPGPAVIPRRNHQGRLPATLGVAGQ